FTPNADKGSVLSIEPPQFVKRIENISSLRGGTIVFQATIKGSMPIMISWLKDNDDILSLGHKYKISVTDTVSVLKIVSTEKKDSGEYTFEVSNDVGNLIIPPKFTKKLKKMDSIKGSFVHLECIVSGSHPISIQWYKDGKEITASDKHKYSFHDNTAFLEINQLEGADSGSYTCEATNKAGRNQCSQILIWISTDYCCCLVHPFSPKLPLGSNTFTLHLFYSYTSKLKRGTREGFPGIKQCLSVPLLCVAFWH
uniref:Ig-like domain-containing protein n=1 Tax=Anolis carolinensis TaxID=28377 RepID=A0A803T195_ANOCA